MKFIALTDAGKKAGNVVYVNQDVIFMITPGDQFDDAPGAGSFVILGNVIYAVCETPEQILTMMENGN